MKIIIIALLGLLVLSKLFRFIITHLHLITFYGFKDCIYHLLFDRGREFNEFGIDMFVGMFGKGKTLSMVHKASRLYKIFGDDITFISNIHLENIPYIPLVNFNQLVDLEENDSHKGYVVLIDEVSSVLSHRNYANFPFELIGLLCQQRKRHIYIMCTAQRFFMVDKVFRSITTHVIDCNKVWRIAKQTVYDAWEYENATNQRDIKRLNYFYWFVRNRDYNGYDTSEMIDKSKCADFISNDDIIKRKGFEPRLVSSVNLKSKKIKVS